MDDGRLLQIGVMTQALSPWTPRWLVAVTRAQLGERGRDGGPNAMRQLRADGGSAVGGTHQEAESPLDDFEIHGRPYPIPCWLVIHGVGCAGLPSRVRGRGGLLYVGRDRIARKYHVLVLDRVIEEVGSMDFVSGNSVPNKPSGEGRGQRWKTE